MTKNRAVTVGVFLWSGLCAAVGCGDMRMRDLPTGTGPSAQLPRVTRVPGVAPRDAGDRSDVALPDASRPGVVVERAILVSIDGLGGRWLEQQFEKGKLPAFAAIMQAGSSTTNARADYDFTITLPNHTSMITGRPVARDLALPADAHHGWMSNWIVDPPITLHNGGNKELSYVASIFDVAHDRGKRTCMYAGKLKFMVYPNSYNAKNGAPDVVGTDHGRNKVDRFVILEGNTEQLITTAETDIAGGVCDLAFIHIADLDTPIGHNTGWGTDTWFDGLDRVDGWIGRLAQAAGIGSAGASVGLVVTADHGGAGEDHGDFNDLWNYQIPFFAVGPRFTPNSDLYALAGIARLDPGLERPRYSAARQPVRNADAANVVLTMLGLPEVPGSFMRDLLPPE